jgi:hypothetical protein
VPGWRERWVSEKCNVALEFDRGAGGGGYSEAALVVSSILTALAAEVWPGRGVDKVRFIELLVRHTNCSPSLDTVSVPLLVQRLNKDNNSAAATLASKFLPVSGSRVVTSIDVDALPADLLDLAPQIGHQLTREHSYACLLYSELRSAYAHEYRPGARADSWPMTSLQGQSISYVNRIDERLIHFHIEWLTQLAVRVAATIDSMSLPLQRPSKWWINEYA